MTSDEITEAAPNATPPRAADAVFARGARVGRYLVIDRLGQGGMGVVYSAYDPELDRKVALKLLHAGSSSAGPDMERARDKVMQGLFGDDPGTAETVAPPLDRDQQRLLREAQAAARINHPNVVTVHDVGQHLGRVFIAMEFVAGCTLREWSAQRRRSWREVIDVMLDAARGLAAAHESGLVHRDFKPDNLMIGDDGRVRVMDFGLVRPDLRESTAEAADDELQPTTRALALDLTHGARVGTPAYMSPEQHSGHEVDARSDQFSFCVALWEALFGIRPFVGDSIMALSAAVTTGRLTPPPASSGVPGAIRRLVERGLAVAPEQRWPSMAALTAALRKDPTRGRRWALGGGVGLAVLLGIGGVQRIQRQQRLAACDREAAAPSDVWNEAAREQVEARIMASGAVYAADTVHGIEPMLDDYVEQWSGIRSETCSAAVTGPAPLHATETLACLDDGLDQLESTVATLAEADAGTVRRAVLLVSDLSRPSSCVDESVLRRRSIGHDSGDDPNRLWDHIRASKTLRTVGRLREAEGELDGPIARSKEAGPSAALAAAEVQLGTILEDEGEYAQAERVLMDAAFDATSVGDETTVAQASTRLTSVIGYREARPADAAVWQRWATVLLTRSGLDDELPGAALDDAVGPIESAGGHYDEAIHRLEHAVEVKRARLGPDHPEVALSLNSLGNAQIQHSGLADAAKSWSEALAILERALGPLHPDLAPVLSNLAQVRFRQGDPKAARELLERAIELRRAELGADHPEVAKALANLGVVRQATGDLQGAREAFVQSTEILERALGPEHRAVAQNLDGQGQIERMLGNVDTALALHRRALAIQERQVGPDSIDVAVSCAAIGSDLEAKGDLEAARKWFQRSLDICLADGDGGHPIHTPMAWFELGSIDVRLGRTDDAIAELEHAAEGLEASHQAPEYPARARFLLGTALWHRPPDRVRARALVSAARAALVELGDDEWVEKIDAWSAGHTG